MTWISQVRRWETAFGPRNEDSRPKADPMETLFSPFGYDVGKLETMYGVGRAARSPGLLTGGQQQFRKAGATVRAVGNSDRIDTGGDVVPAVIDDVGNDIRLHRR